MNMTPEQIDKAFQQALWSASAALERGGDRTDAAKAAEAVMMSAKAAIKALDQP